MLALTEPQGYLIVGLVAAIIPLGSAYLALRAQRQATKLTVQQQATDSAITAQGSLIDDLREDRDAFRNEVRDLRADRDTLRTEVSELRDQMTDVRRELVDCHRQRAEQADRIAELERTR